MYYYFKFIKNLFFFGFLFYYEINCLNFNDIKYHINNHKKKYISTILMPILTYLLKKSYDFNDDLENKVSKNLEEELIKIPKIYEQVENKLQNEIDQNKNNQDILIIEQKNNQQVIENQNQINNIYLKSDVAILLEYSVNFDDNKMKDIINSDFFYNDIEQLYKFGIKKKTDGLIAKEIKESKDDEYSVLKKFKYFIESKFDKLDFKSNIFSKLDSTCDRFKAEILYYFVYDFTEYQIFINDNFIIINNFYKYVSPLNTFLHPFLSRIKCINNTLNIDNLNKLNMNILNYLYSFLTKEQKMGIINDKNFYKKLNDRYDYKEKIKVNENDDLPLNAFLIYFKNNVKKLTNYHFKDLNQNIADYLSNSLGKEEYDKFVGKIIN